LSASIAEDDDDFPFQFSYNERFQTADPVVQGFHVRLSECSAELPMVHTGNPRHADNHNFRLRLQSVIGEFEGVPWTLIPVWAEVGQLMPHVGSLAVSGGINLLQIRAYSDASFTQPWNVLAKESRALQSPGLVGFLKEILPIIENILALSGDHDGRVVIFGGRWPVLGNVHLLGVAHQDFGVEFQGCGTRPKRADTRA
jgi:hypothetical protein